MEPILTNKLIANGLSSLILAIINSHIKTALYLVENGAEVSLVDEWGDSALALATERDPTFLVEKILAKCANR